MHAFTIWAVLNATHSCLNRLPNRSLSFVINNKQENSKCLYYNNRSKYIYTLILHVRMYIKLILRMHYMY